MHDRMDLEGRKLASFFKTGEYWESIEDSVLMFDSCLPSLKMAPVTVKAVGEHQLGGMSSRQQPCFLPLFSL